MIKIQCGKGVPVMLLEAVFVNANYATVRGSITTATDKKVYNSIVLISTGT